MDKTDKIFYYKPDEETKSIYVYDTSGKTLKTIDMEKWEDYETRTQVGLICYDIAEGKSVQKVAKGTNGYLAVDEFFRLVECNEEYAEMYKDAKQRRINYLLEELVDTDNEGKVKVKAQVIKELKLSMKEEKEGDTGVKVKGFNSYMSEDKLKEVKDKHTTK